MALRLPREFGPVNWLGLKTHVGKEIQRFLKVGLQTLAAPVVTSLMFLAIFSLALGRSVQEIGGVAFIEFLAPGLIMMATIQNAFNNTVSSIMVSKIQGNIVDVMLPPLTPGEFILGFICGGLARGILVALCVGASMWFFVDIRVHNIGFILLHAICAAGVMSMMGLIIGIWADKFDHQAAISNFIITPLSFLSGTFYSIERLPEHWQNLAMINPFFYMIDGFRFGFIGHHDADLGWGLAYVILLNIILWFFCYRLVFRGYKLKS
ncbi:MAG: ABC transporter permease [Rhodospirillaceae bacterium]|jgi:ABC-2 type transport system permease protein